MHTTQHPTLMLFDLDDTLCDTTGQLAGSYEHLETLTLFPGVADFLSKIKCRKVLVTQGDTSIQNKKIDILGLRSLFDRIDICTNDEGKHEAFKKAISEFNIDVTTEGLRAVYIIGNRIDSEIRYGNMLGCSTIFIQHGKYKDMKPKDLLEVPTMTLGMVTDLTKHISFN
jgi:FMN phosphatase YigB (HAD superfamily)